MGRYADIARKARRLTNKQLTTEMAAVGPLNRDDFRELMPRKRDKQTFLELMEMVETERDEDLQLAYLRDNLAGAGKIVLRILGALF